MPLYISTRNKQEKTSSYNAIIHGLSSDGGLYTPFDFSYKINITELPTLTYQDTAVKILSFFFDDLNVEEISQCVHSAYDNNFSDDCIVPIHYTSKVSFMELYHGPTSAFKDLALTILPHLMVTSYKAENRNDTIAILTATSGDTGKAALSGFKDVPHTNVTVFYPEDGVSDVQKRQMQTSLGDNIKVCAVKGNFDDCQRMVKNAVTSSYIQKTLHNLQNISLSSANSINIGRLIPQIVYYAYTYGQLVKDNKITLGQKVNFSVPTGNFGDILAGWYAKQIGIPINKLICASNTNNVLTDFINTGTYDTNRPFISTTSPSMDILISSNLERLLFVLSDYNDEYVKALMNNLKNTGKYTINPTLLEKIQNDFVGVWVSEEKSQQAIHDVYSNENYLMDPHTSIAYQGYVQYVKESHDDTPTIIVSTASPYKFSKAVLKAITNLDEPNDIDAMASLHKVTGIKIPKNLSNIIDLPIRFTEQIDKEDGLEYIAARLREISHVQD